MITLRLDTKLEQSLENASKHMGVTKSELIRRGIREYLAKLSSPDPWELGKDLFGKYASGQGNLSEERKEIIKNKIRDKRSGKNTD